ncbi:MAG: ATP-binding protein [Rivularia sp. (in: cyanobacteria)]
MNQLLADLNQFWVYLIECFNILYWAYLKPYTFANWLRDIHPQLKPTDNPFKMRSEFINNPRLHRYAQQVLWITAIVPLLAIIPVGLIGQLLIASKGFSWWFVSIFFIGWWIGLWLARNDEQKLEKWFTRCSFLFVPLLLIVHLYVETFLSDQKTLLKFLLDSIQASGWGIALGIAWGVSWGATGIVIFGIALGIFSGLVLKFLLRIGNWRSAWRIGWFVVSSNASGIALGVTVGILFGIGFGIESDAGLVNGLGFVFFIIPGIFYFIEMLWMFLLFLLSYHVNVVSLLRWIPPRFDERIFSRIPFLSDISQLPFLAEMIKRAYLQNPAAARETIDYLNNFTNQQKVAADAIAKIALDSLDVCQTVTDIAEVSYQLDWITSPLSKENGWIVPLLLDVSQNVNAAVEASSDYRTYQSLQDCIGDLRELIDRLAKGRSSRLATIYGRIAERWLSILKTAQRNLKQKALESEEIRQVYLPGSALDPEKAKERFKGRNKIFREIETLALSEQPPVLLLYGGRRSGKTSALKYLPRRVKANLVPLLVDLQGGASVTTLPGLAQYLADTIIEAARRLPRRLELPKPHKKKLQIEPFLALQDWLLEIEYAFPNKQFLLCLDEYERLGEVVEVTNSYAPLNFFRHIQQHRSSWNLLFSGAHQLSELPAYWSDYLINTRALKMSYLSETEARELIVEPIDDFAKNIYEESAVEAIIYLTRCQPYLVQLMCYELIELLNDKISKEKRKRGTTKAYLQDVETVIPIVLERGDQYFREVWRNLTQPEQNFLLRLVEGEIPNSSDKGIIRNLVRKEILQQQSITGKFSEPEKRIDFQVPLVQKYIEQVIQEEI